MVNARPRKLKLVKLPKPKADPDCEFIRTLVWVLEQARAGKISAYAMVFEVEEDGHHRSIEAADCADKDFRHHALGMIRRMEFNFMKREWPDE